MHTTLDLGTIPHRPREVREGLTDDVVAARLRQAAGAVDESTLATIEAATGLWERGFAAGRSASLSAPHLALIGRALLLRGESVWHIRTNGRIVPVATWDIRGDTPDPGGWRYRVSIASPDTTRTRNVTAGSVLHFRIGSTSARPWAGCSPLDNSSATRLVLARIERSGAGEYNSPTGRILPVPNITAAAGLAEDIRSLDGAVALGESMTARWNEGGAVSSGSTDWRPQRLGPDNPETAHLDRESVERSILAACGVPLALVAGSTTAESRESWRRFLHGTIAPIGELMAAELRRVGMDDAMDWSNLFASDLAARTRAYKQLREAEFDAEEARRICGL